MVKIIALVSFIFFFMNNFNFSFEIEALIKKANLLLDMMEYESAIMNYLKILSQNPQQRDIRKKIAYAYYKLNKVDEALKYLKEELRYYSNNPDAHDFLVHILHESNNLKEVDQLLAGLDFPIRLTMENPYIGGLGCFILGVHFKEIKEYEKAEIFFRKAMIMGFDQIKCYVQLVDMEISKGLKIGQLKFGDFLEISVDPKSILAEAIGNYQFRPEFLLLIGLTYFGKSKTDVSYFISSIKCFELAVKLYPNFRDALFNLACINYNSNDYIKASEYFRRILELEPEDKEIKFYLDCAQEKLETASKKELMPEQCPKGIVLSRKFIDNPELTYEYKSHNDPSFVLDSINNLGLEFAGNGEFNEALKRFVNGLRMYPECPGIHFNMAIVYSWLEDFENAEKHALGALRIRDVFGTIPDSRKLEIMREKGEEIQQKTKIPLSQWNFEAALKEGNYFLDAWDTLGYLYFKKKEYDKSVLAFKRVLEIYEGDAMGHYNLGCIYWTQHDWENAEEEWKKAIKFEKETKKREESVRISKDQLSVSLIVFKRPISFQAHKSLGWLYLEKNLPDKALKEFTDAIELEPGDPEPYYEVGKIYQARSKLDNKNVRKAISCFEKYLYLGGDKEKEVKEFLKSLKKLNK